MLNWTKKTGCDNHYQKKATILKDEVNPVSNNYSDLDHIFNFDTDKISNK